MFRPIADSFPAKTLPKRVFPLLVGLTMLITIQNFGTSYTLAQPVPSGVRYLSTNLQAFGIPFKIDADDDSYIEVQLYLSRDQGKTWRLLDRQSTDQNEFQFQAQGDGQYWFGLKTLNRNRQLVPPGNVTPGLIVVVDTVDPELDLQVSADAAGRVECRWRASDPNIDPNSLRIEYQSLTAGEIGGEAWTAVPVDLKGTARNGIYADQIAWWPETTERSLRVRVSIADKAGNRVQQERALNLAPTPWRHRGEATTQNRVDRQTDPFAPMQETRPIDQQAMVESNVNINSSNQPMTVRKQISNGSQTWNSEPEYFSQPQQSSSSTSQTPRPNPEIAPLTSFQDSQSDQPTGQPLTQLPPSNPSVTQQYRDQVVGQSSTAGPVNQYQGPSPQVAMNGSPGFTTGAPLSTGVESNRRANSESEPGDDASNWAAVEESQSSVDATKVQPLAQPVPIQPEDILADRQAVEPTLPRQNPVARSVSQRSIIDSGDYEISDASVQMIGSKRFRLNYGIDAIDPSGVARVDLWMTRDDGQSWTSWGSDPDNISPFPVEVEEEGRYGFRIVVHSRDGLTGRGPSSGDRPDIIVHVDTQAPMVQIISVPYGRGAEAGRLIINYRVADPHLTLRPVSIYYSATPDGPWQPIEEGLRNEGRYVWKPNTAVPDRIFLRLEAVDRAGNRGIHQLNQAIDVSGLIPRGTIHGVTPVGSN